MFRLRRVEQYCNYEDLDEGSRLNAIYQIESEELTKYINNYIDNKVNAFKESNPDDYDLQLFILDLETTDEPIIAYCKEKNLQFNSFGDLVENKEELQKQYKNNPYNAF